ncbi:LysR family transcriptional regulator [Sphingomonas sp.]|uniref:LysR family transcriptional regulator n=1 Tax=Sphingomonas sp. TaxID=28214 RepID=UPI00286A7132|nr:LysR family transcriptional regulator [Sphingomonas sp.]
MDWNDLRHFLAVAERGSTLAAGRELRVSQTTVARRIDALEKAVGMALFERRQAGYALTAVGEALLPTARAVAAATAGFGEAAAAYARDLTGTVRLSTEEIFAVTLLGPMLRDLHDLHPDIRIELDTSHELRDLGAGEADIALRATSTEPPAGVVGRRLCIDDWTLYCSRDYAARHGVPTSVEALRGHAIVGGGGGNLWRAYEAWIHEFGLEGQVAMHHASSTGLLSAVRSGFGIAVLPRLAVDDDPDLIRCLPPRKKHGRLLWLLTHERVRHAPRVRVVIDFLYERLKKRVSELGLST